MIPPLLAELIQRAVAPRLEAEGVQLSIVAVIDQEAEIAVRLGDLAPDRVITTTRGASLLAPGLAGLLTLSADLARFTGPEPGDVAPLTVTSLVARLLERPGRCFGRDGAAGP